nr:hypothetical protein [uncultured bacterium]
MVDAGLEPAQLLAQRRRQRVFADADHALAEVVHHDGRVAAHAGLQLVQRAAALLAHLGNALLHHGQRRAHAFEQDVVLALDVVVQRGLAHMELLI